MNSDITSMLPDREDLVSLVAAVQSEIEPDFRAYDDSENPGILLTVGWDPETGAWDYQTGDISFSGGAYGFPVWGQVEVDDSTSPETIVAYLIDDLVLNIE